MGEVYKARDTRLDRIVAIKILPEVLAADPEFRDRFDREARVISQLDHPHICALYDVGEVPNPQSQVPNPVPIRFLVMQYLEGETLADRLKKGALPLHQSLGYAIEIADALDTAHRAGVTHRDLKPANIMLTKSGSKLLDFGLAKQARKVVGRNFSSAVTAEAGLESKTRPTYEGLLTAQGTILGTFQYMSPEQIEGEEADARTDLFAFGVVLYEMLTGKKAFTGKTQASLFGAILKDEPPPISTIQPLTPPLLDHVVKTCLAKDRDERWQTARDLLRELKWVVSGAASIAGVDAAPKSVRSDRLAWTLAGVLGVSFLAAGVVALRHVNETTPAAEPIEFTISAPENAAFAANFTSAGTGVAPEFAVSPDGRQVVFLASQQGRLGLWIRSLGGLTSRMLPGTDQAAYPFWSPDGRYVGFFSSGKLKKIQVADGSLVVLCDVVSGRGGTWNRDNVIVFAPGGSGRGLQRVSAGGGQPTTATTLDTVRGENYHWWPHFLPDGRHFLYLAVTALAGPDPQRPSEIRVASLESNEVTTVVTAESAPAYSAGHLLYWRDGRLMAHGFDATTHLAHGEPFPIADQVTYENSRYASFAVSPAGVLIYERGAGRVTSRLTWLDRTGNVLGTVGEPGVYNDFALAPDGRHVALTIVTGVPERRDIWVIDVATSASSRLTFDSGFDSWPVWSPDGERIVYSKRNTAKDGLYLKPANGGGQEELVLKAGTETFFPGDWSRDARFVAYTQQSNASKSSYDLWVLPLAGDRKPFVFLQTLFREENVVFAPDGRWLAYQSDESGQPQVFVQPFPPTGAKYQVSRDGGTQPMWRGDGQELFFLAPDRTIMAAAVRPSSQFEPASPQPLFASGASDTMNRHAYAVSKDGQRFLVNVAQPANQTALTVVSNWPAAVQK